MQKRTTKLEEFTNSQSYEDITDMETNFLLELYESVYEVIRSGEKLTLARLSVRLRVSTRELSDYLPEILEMERMIILNTYE